MSLGRYTPKHSVEALRQKWMAVNPNDPRLNQVGRVLVHAAKEGHDRFAQVCKELEPEQA
jgi:hypothetical protein